uniref:Phosphoinositide-3-kinase, regulatory subunit 6b n=1 Tax=Oreochromis aureus TaxID=47969 RepID=A0AAZ1XTY1_OREAU
MADPAVFSVSLEATVRAYLEVSRRLTNTRTMEKSMLFHVLQTGLEMTCQSSRLAQALEVNTSMRALWTKRHGDNNNNISYPLLSDVMNDEQGPVYSTTVPLPEMNFLMWTDEEMLFLLETDVKFDGKERISRDSGIVKDLEDPDDAVQPPYMAQKTLRERRNAIKNSKSAEKLSLMKEKMKEDVTGNSPLLKEERSHTARVVVLGDDSTLGKLTKAYYVIRKKEAKRNMLTKKLDLQLYYIPVSDAEASSRLSLASCLERVDPWYSVNVSSLGAAIPTLPELVTNRKLSLYLLDTLCYYLRCGTQPVNLPVYSVKMTRSNSDLASVEELFVSHLEADIPDFRHLKDRQQSMCANLSVHVCVDIDATTVTDGDITWLVFDRGTLCTTKEVIDGTLWGGSKIKTQNISIRTMEQRTLCVCLDKDPRRTYTDVQKIEISPCLDPGCTIRCRYSIGSEQELPLSKYLDKVMSLPINSFSGVSM